MSTLGRAVNKYPLTTFAIAAYALSWWSIPFADGGILPYGPFLAAVIVLALTQGRPGLSELLRRMTSWRGGWFWLLFAPALVIAHLLPALAINVALSATIAGTSHIRSIGPTLLMLLVLGGVWEEPGWTGYALPMLQDRYTNHPYGLLMASLHTGALRAVWHLPLVISGAIPWYELVFYVMAFQFLISWLFNRSGGSVLVVMLFHLTSNVIGAGITVPLFTGSDYGRYIWLFTAMAWLLAIPLARSNKWSMGRLRPAH